MASTNNLEAGEEQSYVKIEDLDYIVDTDGHVMDAPIENWLDHIDPEYEVYKKQFERSEFPFSEIFNFSWPAVKSGTMYGSSDEVVNTDYNIERKISEMEDFSISHSLISETLLLTVNTINDPRLALAVMNGFNNWMLREFGDHTDEGVYGSILVSEHKPEKSAEEIDRLAEEDFFAAVSLPPGYTMGSRKYDPIYQAAEDHGLPLTLHGTGVVMGWDNPKRFRELKQNFEKVYTISEQFSFALVTAFSNGLPERYPDLDIVFQEFGVGQVAPLLWKMDDWYLDGGVPSLSKRPSEYIDDQFWFTTQPLGLPPKGEYMAQLVDQIGASNVMFSADLPHQTFDTPSEFLDKINAHFTESEVRGMMGETAIDLFNMGR